MRPVDSFLRSVRDAFRPADTTPDWIWIAAALLVSTVVIGGLIRRRRRLQAEVVAFARFLAERQVSPTQFQLLDRLASHLGLEARTVATQIDAFERASAAELSRHVPSTATPTEIGPSAIFVQVGALRRALGFERIGQHFALLTSRQLGAGQVVEVAGGEATVVEVNEGWFAVTGASGGSFPTGPIGTRVRVTLVHGQEARYELRCPLLAQEPGEATQRFIFGHDEQPTRIQARKAVRVTVRGPVRLIPLRGTARGKAAEIGAELGIVAEERVAYTHLGDAEPAEGEPAPGDHPSAESPLQPLGTGSLLDISVGGAAIDASIQLPVGSLVQLSFELEGVVYRDLLALVLECRIARPRGLHRLRLEFRALPQADEHRLAASVARYSAKRFAQEN